MLDIVPSNRFKKDLKLAIRRGYRMDLSTAINVFLRQAVYENSFPFDIRREIPNADTIAAMREAEEMSRHPENYKKYGSFSELLQEVGTDA